MTGLASIMSLKCATKHDFKILPSNIRVKSQNNSIDLVKGVNENLKIEIGNSSTTIKLLITDNEDHDILLELDWFHNTKAWFSPAHKILKFVDDSVSSNNLKDLRDDDLDNVLASEFVDDDDFVEDKIFVDEIKEIKIQPVSHLT